MKVLHLIASINPASGGPIEGIFRSAEVWAAEGLGERQIATLDSPDAPWIASCPLQVFPLGRPGSNDRGWHSKIPWLRYGYTPHLVPWLKKNAAQYDAIIVNGLWNYTALAARLALPSVPTPYFVFPHGMLDPWFKRSARLKHLAKQCFWWFCEGPLLRRARFVLFTTEDERRLARNMFWPYRLDEYVLGYGTADVKGDPDIQIAAFRKALPALGNRRFLLFLGRIHPKKGCDLLIEAFAAIAKDNPDLDLVMAGPNQTGWRSALDDLAQTRMIQHRIHWPGMVAGDIKWGAFRACDAFILPSHQENFGIVVAEAMACGKPVLISNKVNIWREVEACGGGLVGDDTRAGTLSLLRDFLALGSERRQAMAVAARQGFESHFDIRSSALRLHRLVTENVRKS